MDAYLGGDLQVLLGVELSECTSDGFFRCAISITGSGVDPVDTTSYCGMQDFQLLVSVCTGHQAGHGAGSEADLGHAEAGSTEATVFHEWALPSERGSGWVRGEAETQKATTRYFCTVGCLAGASQITSIPTA